MKNRFFISVALLLAATGVALYLLAQTKSAEGNATPVVEHPQSTMGVNAVAEKHQQAEEKATADESVTPPILQYVGNVEPDFSIYGENARAYRTYNEKTLEALAEGGDLLAIKELVHRIIRNGVPEEELQNLSVEEENRFWKNLQRRKEKYLELAIVYGDTELFDYAKNMYGNDFNTRDPKQVRDSLLEQLAFTEFSAMRGAESFKYMIAPIIIEGRARWLDGPVKLTEEDKTFIRKRAQAIYDGYENRRAELGLGPFQDKSDNDPNIIGYDPFQIYLDAMGENAF